MFSRPCPLLYAHFILLLCYVKKPMAISRNETDHLSLLDIRHSIGGLDAWNQSLHFCQWQGITCSKRHQRVVSLFLPSLSLSGMLSPSIGNLSFLRLLNLTENKFHGEIPEEIGRLSHLQYLDISINVFEGLIPVNLSQCTKLKIITTARNDLTGDLPVELGHLSKLEFLSLENNILSGEIPSSFCNLSSLKTFSLMYNNFEGLIPDIFGKLSSLMFLSLGKNKFSGKPPASVYNITSLEILGLEVNQLNGNLPPNIFIGLPNLGSILVGGNQFGGPLPVSFPNASNLQTVDIDSNTFTGDVPIHLGIQGKLTWINFENNSLGSGKAGDLNFISSLTNCTNLQNLYLMTNNFGGILPHSLANLSTQLESFNLGKNQIFGTIPEWIMNLSGLIMLALHQNNFHGSIPSSIGYLRGLNQLFLSGNNLRGEIPHAFGNMSQLYLLSLYDNQLHGRIPSSLRTCESLQILGLSNNNLNGNINEEIFGISSLTLVDLAGNALSGSIPSSVGYLRNLQELSLSRNKFSGAIPTALGNCEILERLSMHHNQFEGSLPESLGSLKGLQLFDISSNNLSGRIPKTLENLTYLEWLNLSSNKLEGEVPREGVFKNGSAISVTGNSELCGGIPELQLPRCLVQVSKDHGRMISLKIAGITVGVALFSILGLASAILCWRRKLKVKDSSSLLKGDGHVNVTYRDIFQATGGFSPENLIGSGSFGRVYKGVLPHEEIEVAIKVFDLHQKGGLKSFMSECASLRNIRHRNLVKILTSCSSADFEGNDFKALVLEFMPNGSLEDWLHQLVSDQSKKLNLLQRLNVAIDVASALSYLHQECHVSVVHRDLKPSNVLLDGNLVAHVGDFGLAKIISESTESFYQSQSTIAGVNGSIGYIAPEYGAGAETSTSGDVYSFGILVLEVFTGRRPTDEIFKDGLNLHVYASKSLPEQVTMIVDPVLLSEEDETINGATDDGNQNNKRNHVSECLTAIIKIGVACSIESPPEERMAMRDVIRELHIIRDSFIGTRIYSEHGTRDN